MIQPAVHDRWGIPRWVVRLVFMVTGIVVVLFAAYHVLQRLRGLMILLLISLFLSVALEPGVNYLSRRGWKRGLATGAMFLTLVLTAGLFVGLMVPLIVDQVSRLATQAPGYIDQIESFLQGLGVEFTGENIDEAIAEIRTELTSFAADIAGSIFGVGQALLSTIFQLLTIGLSTVYMTAEGPRLRRTVCSVLPPDRQKEVLRVWEIAIDKTGGYFYSRALLAAFSTTVGWAVFTALGVPFALALALWMGVLSQFVPVVGTYIGGALPLLIALLVSPGKAVAVLVYIVVYQQIENYLLAPKITARTMALHPAVSFGSAIAGGTLLGFSGAIMALPAAATIQAFISTYISRHEVVQSALTEEPTERSQGEASPET